MHKDFHNRILKLPQGTPARPWVNLMWLLVFTPFIVMLTVFVGVGLFAIGDVLYGVFFR